MRLRVDRARGCEAWSHVVPAEPGLVVLALLLEQVADLGEQFLLLSVGCGRRLGLFFLDAHDPAQELHDEEEQGRGHDQKVDDVAEESAIRNLFSVGCAATHPT